MTAISLARIMAEELARVGVKPTAAEGGRPRETVFLSSLPGFGMRLYESGRRSYIVQRRMSGRMRTVTIGSADTLPEAVARDVAARVLLRCQVDENPAETRARVRAVPSWTDYLDEYWSRMAAQWKPRTRETHDSYRRAHLNGAFAGKFIDQIDEEQVARWFVGVTQRGGPGAANRTLDILKAMMRKAEAWGYREPSSNPVAGLRRNRSRPRERFLSEAELARLGAALSSAQAIRPAYADAVRLILLTACRKSEIIALRWSEVKGRRLLLTDSKTGARTVWLGAEARTIIERQPRFRGAEYVFDFGADQSRHRLDPFWQTLRAEADLGELRLHDLRHSYASFAAQRSETLPMIGKLLGHSKVASTARYAHLDDAPTLDASEIVGKKIAYMMRV
jgi:integrase